MRGFLDKLKKVVAREEKTPELAGADAQPANEAAWDEQVRREFMEWHESEMPDEGPAAVQPLHFSPRSRKSKTGTIPGLTLSVLRIS